MKREEALVDVRTTLEWVKDQVKLIDGEVDPEVEAAAICKAHNRRGRRRGFTLKCSSQSRQTGTLFYEG